MCFPIEKASLRTLQDSVTGAGFGASLKQHGPLDLHVRIDYADDNPYSDENFVSRPRELLRLVDGRLGRIASIEGVARTLWPPFRPPVSIVVSVPDPGLMLEMFVLNLFSQSGWDEGGIVLPGTLEALQPSAVDFSNVRELKLKRKDEVPEIEIAALGDELVLLAAKDTPRFRDLGERLEGLVDRRFDLEMALAS